MKLIRYILCGILMATAVRAQTTDSKVPARAAFEQARGLFESDMKAAITAMRGVVDRYPDFADGHSYYILMSTVAAMSAVPDDEKMAAGEKVRAELRVLYENWAKEHPNRVSYQYALGTLLEYSDPDRSVQYYEKCVQLDPKLGNAWDMLALSAEQKGDLARSRELHRKAVEAEPDNPNLWRHLVGAWREENIDRAVEISIEMSARFRGEAATMLSYLATRARTMEKSQEIYELLRDKLPKESADWMSGLFSIYLQSNPAKALALAQEMGQLAPANKTWPVLVTCAQTLIEADTLISQGKADEVVAAIDRIKLPPRGVDRRMLDLTRAKALAAGGQIEKAYDQLLTGCVKTPNDDTLVALRSYGAKLGKSATQVDDELFARRASTAKLAASFSLLNYATGKPVALDDFKGRVVLVNFWYPKCGPCRGEFPFLQSVLEKYRDRGFEILAINGHAPEDQWVMPLIKGWKLGFIPLKGTEEVLKAYKVRSFPANFLCGPDGRIYYEAPPVNSVTAERELGLQIESLLGRHLL